MHSDFPSFDFFKRESDDGDVIRRIPESTNSLDWSGGAIAIVFLDKRSRYYTNILYCIVGVSKLIHLNREYA